jgi:hypothetical protein
MKFWRRKPPPKKFGWRLATSAEGKETWVNLDNVTHMIGDDDIQTTMLFFGSSEKHVEVLETPEYLLSEEADSNSRELIRKRSMTDD